MKATANCVAASFVQWWTWAKVLSYNLKVKNEAEVWAGRRNRWPSKGPFFFPPQILSFPSKGFNKSPCFWPLFRKGIWFASLGQMCWTLKLFSLSSKNITWVSTLRTTELQSSVVLLKDGRLSDKGAPIMCQKRQQVLGSEIHLFSTYVSSLSTNANVVTGAGDSYLLLWSSLEETH